MEKTKFQNHSLTESFRKNIFNLRNFNKVLFIFIILLGIFYIAGANDLAIKGFVLNDLKRQSAKMADENERLELKIMALSSYSAISEKINKLKMVAVGEINYINGSNGIVAKK